MAFKTHSRIAAVAILVVIESLAVYGQQVFVRSDDQQGAGILRTRGQECYVITANHVVAKPGTITIVDSKQAHHHAEVARRFADDIALLRTESVPESCSFDSWQVSSPIIETALKKVITGKLVRVQENGASFQIGVTVKQYDTQFITVSPWNSNDTLSKGWSGSLLYVDDTLVGLLVTEKDGRGEAYRVDYVEQLVGAFFKNEGESANLAQTPQGVCRFVSQWHTGLVSTDLKYYFDSYYVGSMSVREGDTAFKSIDFRCSPGDHKYAVEFTKVDDSSGAEGRTLQCDGPLKVSTARVFQIGVVGQALYGMSCRVYEYRSQ